MVEPYTESALFIDGVCYGRELKPYNGEKSAQFIFKHTVVNPPSREQFETEARDLFASLLACSSPILMWRTLFEVNFETDFETEALIGRAYARGIFSAYWLPHISRPLIRVYGMYSTFQEANEAYYARC